MGLRMSVEPAYMMNWQGAKAAVEKWRAHAHNLERADKDLKAELAKKNADMAGLVAMLDALKGEAPNAPSLALTNDMFVEGPRKGQIRSTRLPTTRKHGRAVLQTR